MPLPFSVKSIFELFFDFALCAFPLYAPPSLYQRPHSLPASPFFRNLLCTPPSPTTLLVVRSPLHCFMLFVGRRFRSDIAAQPHRSFRTEQADLFFPLRSYDRRFRSGRKAVGLRRETSAPSRAVRGDEISLLPALLSSGSSTRTLPFVLSALKGGLVLAMTRLNKKKPHPAIPSGGAFFLRSSRIR